MDVNALKDEELVVNDEIYESFVCCVCLDLLYKPVVLSCGHVSCFWCVHKSMNSSRESHCPVCRNPYHHFPTICEMLHFLLLKTYPAAYKRRENQTLEEEAEMDFFSPQIICSTESFEVMEQSGSANHKGSEGIISEYSSDRKPQIIGTSVEGKRLSQNEHNQQPKILVTDLMCPTCKQLLVHPVVLNCGHVYCENCITDLSVEMLRCKVCQSPHPRGFPKVCLALDQFLEKQFLEEYTQRRDAIQLGQIKVQPETTSCSLPKDSGENISWWSNPELLVHRGAGCDFCGMYPIIGDRYKCVDCEEIVGFDLCGDCYKNRSKRPGRFNQKHTPDHKFELVQYRRMLISRGQDSSDLIVIPDDPASSTDEDENQTDSDATN